MFGLQLLCLVLLYCVLYYFIGYMQAPEALCLFVLSLSPWLIGTVRAEPETVISRAWVQSPDPADYCFRITGVHALS